MDHTESGWKVSTVDIIFVCNFMAIDRPDQKEDLAFDFETFRVSVQRSFYRGQEVQQ